MGFEAPRGRGPRASINVTPLVDVVLVLLIIFMLVAPVMTESLATTPAARRPADTPPPEPQLVIAVAEDGSVEVNGAVVGRALLAEAVAEELRGRPDRPVFFRVDDQARVRDAVWAMDTARGAGAQVLATVVSE